MKDMKALLLTPVALALVALVTLGADLPKSGTRCTVDGTACEFGRMTQAVYTPKDGLIIYDRK